MHSSTVLQFRHACPAGVLTVDLQSCSKERGLVIMIAFVMRAALLPPEHLPDARVFLGEQSCPQQPRAPLIP